MFKKYRIGFDIWGLVLFLIIMIPNFIWFAVPAPNDILRNASVTEIPDKIASVCQILMTVSLCIFRNKEQQKLHLTNKIISVIIFCLLYFLSWIFYYTGITNAVVISGLTLFPCLSFLFFALDRKNMLSVIPISIFTVCHIISGVVNHII